MTVVMTRNLLGTDVKTPPAGASIFGFSGSLRLMMLGVTVICIGFIAFMVVMQLTRPERGSMVVVLLSFVMCGTGAIYCSRVARRSRDRIAVNSEGIWYLARNGPTSFIAWSNVATVKADDTMQRLILADGSGTTIIRAEYQLENFAALREFILSHTDALAHQAPLGTRVFHRSWINKIIFTVFGLPFLILSAQCYREGVAGGFYFTLAVGVYGILLIVFDPVSLKIDADGIVIKYPLWKRSISFDSVTGIALQYVSGRGSVGNVWAAVVIERRQKRNIKLFRFHPGSIALKDALESAWRSSQTTGVPAGTRSEARGE